MQGVSSCLLDPSKYLGNVYYSSRSRFNPSRAKRAVLVTHLRPPPPIANTPTLLFKPILLCSRCNR
jgi:hypothetical protein